MEELFEELIYKHLGEYYPETKFCTQSSEIGGVKYTYVNKISSWQTYIYLTKHRVKNYWCAVITVGNLRGEDILISELNILGFRVLTL